MQIVAEGNSEDEEDDSDDSSGSKSFENHDFGSNSTPKRYGHSSAGGSISHIDDILANSYKKEIIFRGSDQLLDPNNPDSE
jgi:hypothetical protein